MFIGGLTAIAMPFVSLVHAAIEAQKAIVPALAAKSCHLGFPTALKKGEKIASPAAREQPTVL
jgi:hypothetical protein